jgi:serine/threonine-protein kinase
VTDTAMPERLAQYKVLHQRGEGGMGVVYEAFDERLERKVALKLLKPGVMDPTMRARFWREARTAAAISHPNVCQVFDVGDAEGVTFLAMELLEGQSLAQRLVAGPLPWRKRSPSHSVFWRRSTRCTKNSWCIET